MFRSYLIATLRTLLKNRGLTAINILGLAIGMASVILIALYIQYEFSYDRHHVNATRIYRVIRTVSMENTTSVNPRASGALAPALKRDFPEVQEAIRTQLLTSWVKTDDRFFQQDVCVADREIFNVFTIPFVIGDPGTALTQPGSMVLTESMARKFFQNQNPIGKTLQVDHQELSGTVTYFVTGIVRDFPPNSTFYFDCLTATPGGQLANLWSMWQPTGSFRPFFTYLLLPEGYDHRALEQKLPGLKARYLGDEERQTTRYILQPLTRMHLWENGDIKQVYAFGLVAGFILVLACVNFMNLSTARSSTRAREVGLRKVVGASRQQLIGQFLGESVLVALVAMIVALVVVELILPWFNSFIQRDLVLHSTENLWWLIGLIGFGLGVGVIAGSYPAFVLSSFLPTQVMKGDWIPGSKQVGLRKALVVFQFAISIAFITGTIVVQEQLAYIRNKDLGFDKELVIGIPIFIYSWQLHHSGSEDLRRRISRVKQSFMAHPNILKATATRFSQGGYITTDTFRAEGSEADWQMGLFDIDRDFLNFFNIELVAGRMAPEPPKLPETIESIQDLEEYRELVRTYREKGRPFILNETAAQHLGWDDPIGKHFKEKNGPEGYVVGVMKDFHIQTLHNAIRPVVFRVFTGGAKHLYLKLGTQNIPETLAFTEKTWRQFLPQIPFTFWFLNDDLTRVRYENEIRTGNALAVFSGLTVFVACLGLLGLISFRAEQKTKEIGIRKVLGASVFSIFGLLSKEFVKLVIIACVIASPIAYLFVGRWLQDFAYRIDLHPVYFLIGGVLALLLALATMTYQALKAARTNPVDALRTE
ncbi:MAG: ABC transporter permease [Candidatus Latescibacteria bacterium]|nr:ABC transporter permease [Candidatus Latescibacterota bacterium]